MAGADEREMMKVSAASARVGTYALRGKMDMSFAHLQFSTTVRCAKGLVFLIKFHLRCVVFHIRRISTPKDGNICAFSIYAEFRNKKESFRYNVTCTEGD